MALGIYDRAFREYRYSDRREEGSITIYQLQNGTGTGELLCYDVLPGIQLTYNSLDMNTCFQGVHPERGFLQINHCGEGCWEMELSGGMVGFLGEGDMAVNDPAKLQIADSRLPLGRYRGITILLELEAAQASLKKLFPDSGIDLYAIRNKICLDKEWLLLKARGEIEHIFSGLYCVDDRIRKTYNLVKTVELLLFLSTVDNKSSEVLPRFSHQVVEATKNVCSFLMENPFTKITVSELAGRFIIAETNLQLCFKSIYGQPVGSFIRSERIKRAASLLRDHEELSVGKVAVMVGYANQSKFTSAFKAVIGQTPLSYRHQNAYRNEELEQKQGVAE